MVADALVYHPAVAHYLRYVATTIGRDKVLRTLQYFARFYAWYLYRTNRPTSAIAPWSTIKTQFGLTRKILRAGKFVEHYKAAAALYDGPPNTKASTMTSDNILKYLGVTRQLGYGFYLTFDFLTLPDALGVKKYASAKEMQQRAYKAWFIGLAANAVAGAYTLWLLRQREAALNKNDGESVVESKKIEKQRAATNLQLISDLCDLTVPSSALGYANLDDGIVGLAGTVSSLIGAWATWQKTA